MNADSCTIVLRPSVLPEPESGYTEEQVDCDNLPEDTLSEQEDFAFSIENIYRDYNILVQDLVRRRDLSHFKQNKIYNKITEHLPKAIGDSYYFLFAQEFPKLLSYLPCFCEENDSIGDPQRFPLAVAPVLLSGLFDRDGKRSMPNLPPSQANRVTENNNNNASTASSSEHKVSPTSLRYIYHAALLLKHVETMISGSTCTADLVGEGTDTNPAIPKVTIVEIGGGYGGMCLAVSHLAKHFKGFEISSYILIDLPNVIELQKLYLSHFNLPFRWETKDASNFGKDVEAQSNMFLVSNYAFGEIRGEFQQKYVKHLFPKIHHGFMVWNMSPIFEWGLPLRIEPEKPLTGAGNKFVYF